MAMSAYELIKKFITEDKVLYRIYVEACDDDGNITDTDIEVMSDTRHLDADRNYYLSLAVSRWTLEPLNKIYTTDFDYAMNVYVR